MVREGDSRIGEKGPTMSRCGRRVFQAGWRTKGFGLFEEGWSDRSKVRKWERGRRQMMEILIIHTKVIGSYSKCKGKPLEG